MSFLFCLFCLFIWGWNDTSLLASETIYVTVNLFWICCTFFFSVLTLVLPWVIFHLVILMEDLLS